MDTPIALGIAVGFGHSAWATITGRGEVWFDSVAVLIAASADGALPAAPQPPPGGEASERLLTLVPASPAAPRDGGRDRGRATRTGSARGDLVEVPRARSSPSTASWRRA